MQHECFCNIAVCESGQRFQRNAQHVDMRCKCTILTIISAVMKTFSCQKELMEMDVQLDGLCFLKLSSIVGSEMGVSMESSRSASQ